MKKAYITGATGTIGMALINTLLSQKIDVTVFLRPDSDRNEDVRALQNDRLNIVELGLEQIKSYTEKLTRTEKKEEAAFFHFGWVGTFGSLRNDFLLQEKNVTYSLDAVMLADVLGCSTFVGAGSQAEYGRVSGELDETTPLNPETAYGKAKLLAEEKTRDLCHALSMNHVWFRILSVFGPYDGPNTMVMSTVKRLINGEHISLTAGEQIWDYIYSEDAAEAIYLAACRSFSVAGSDLKPESQIYCLGSGNKRPLKDYVKDICDEVCAQSSLLGFGEVPDGEGQVMYLVANTERLCRDTGFKCRYTFREGIRRTIDWVKAREVKEK